MNPKSGINSGVWSLSPQPVKKGLMASAVSPFCLWVTGWVTNGGKNFQYLQLFAEKWPFFGPFIGAAIPAKVATLDQPTNSLSLDLRISVCLFALIARSNIFVKKCCDTSDGYSHFFQ